MSLRDVMNDLMAGLDPDVDPAEVLAAYGFEDVQPEAFSTALLSFAEQSPMETADALAPVVTRLSPVPFEVGDLPDSPQADAILNEGGDAFSLFQAVAPTDASLGEIYDDADPSDFDDDADGNVYDQQETTVDEVEDDYDDSEDDDSDEIPDITDTDDDGDGIGDVDEADGDVGADHVEADYEDEAEDYDEDEGGHIGADEDEDEDEEETDGYGDGGVTSYVDDQDDADDEDGDDQATGTTFGYDDLEDLGDFDRIDDDDHLDSGPVDHHEPSIEHDVVAHESDDPAELGFDLD